MNGNGMPELVTPNPTYSHSLKLEDTSKGLRISVHVYSNNQEQVIQEAFETYLKARMTAMDNKIPLAPTEAK